MVIGVEKKLDPQLERGSSLSVRAGNFSGDPDIRKARHALAAREDARPPIVEGQAF